VKKLGRHRRVGRPRGKVGHYKGKGKSFKAFYRKAKRGMRTVYYGNGKVAGVVKKKRFWRA
jgi:hypothetical protein